MDHMSSPRQLVILLLGIAALSCGEQKDTAGLPSEPPDSCDTGLEAPSWTGWAEGFFRTNCGACHAASALDRNGAPASVSFDTPDEVAAQAAAIRRTVLTDSTMPVGGGVPEEDLRLLARYLDCGILDD
jgi:uncharacterized membrane protein